MNFSQFCAAMEEWKPFPHDKVARQIKKKKERNASTQDMKQAGEMEGIARVMKTTDAHRTGQKQAGKSYNKTSEKEQGAQEKADAANKVTQKAKEDREKADAKLEKKGKKYLKKINKAKAKGKPISQSKRDKVADKMKKKSEKGLDKHVKAYNNQSKREYQAGNRTGERIAVTRNRDKYVPYTDEEGNRRKDYRGGMKDSKSDLERQAEHNRKVNADRKTAKRMMDKAGLEKAYKKKSAPNSRTESLNFTQWLDAMVPPLYEANGVPQCPPGYRFDKKNLMCVPKTDKDDVSNEKRGDKKDMSPENMPGFNTIGSHGQNGSPHAYEESRYGPNPWGYESGRPWTKKDNYYTGAKDDYYNGQPEASPFFEATRDFEKEDEDAKRFAKQDARMKYGKAGRESSLMPGEVRKPKSRRK